MPNSQQSDSPIGGRYGRVIGAVFLIHFVLLCVVKTAHGQNGELLWISHVSLFMAGVGLLSRSPLLVATSLTSVLGLHSAWLFDFFSWRVAGVYPLGVTSYLPDADLWTWLGTLHHFYLAPTLVVIMIRHHAYPRSAFPMAVGIFSYLTVMSRLFLPPALNVNGAFALLPLVDHPAIRWVNSLPAPAHVTFVVVLASLAFMLPSHMLLRLIGRPRPASADMSTTTRRQRNPWTLPTPRL